MSIVLTSPAGSPTAAGVGGVVKVSPVVAGYRRQTFASLGQQQQHPVTLDFSEHMGLAVRVHHPGTGSPTSSKQRFAPITAVALKAQNTVVMSAPVSPVKSAATVISPIKAGQSVLNKRPSPVFTIASPKTRPAAGGGAAAKASPAKTQPSSLTPDSPTRLRDLLMAQLDLIQRQSEAIVSKDRQLQQLRRENKQLQQRLQEFNEDVRVEVTPPKRPPPQAVDKASGPDTPRKATGRKRVHSFSKDEAASTDEDEDEVEDSPVVETPETYFTFQGEAFCDAEARHIRSILSQSEVPRWRENPVTPEATAASRGRGQHGADSEEAMSEEALSKRHDKPEALEKRRKRWDLQILRQQRHVERLRAAQEGGGEGEGGTAAPCPSTSEAPTAAAHIRTFFPDPVRATHIHVGESLPVSAFGCPLPQLEEVEFTLPFAVAAAAAASSTKRKSSTTASRKSVKQ